MKRMWELAAGFTARCDGQDLMEYGLLAALIAVIAIATMSMVGTTLNTVFYETFPRGI